jgi:hypothetical protein
MSNIDEDDSDEVFHVAAANYAHAIDGFSIEDSFGVRLDNTLTDIDITNRSAYTILEFEIDYTGPTYAFINGFYGSQPFSLYPPGTAFGGPQPYNLIDSVFLPQSIGPVAPNGTTYSYIFNQVITTPFGSYVLNRSYPINHLATNAVVKTEYFYNRAQINFYFAESIGDAATASEENYKYAFRNIKYTEVDMIPFFRYATESRVNQSILAPLSAVATPINYSDSEFSLIDSINITETLFETAVNPVINLSGAGSIESNVSTNQTQTNFTSGLVRNSSSKGSTSASKGSKGGPSS